MKTYSSTPPKDERHHDIPCNYCDTRSAVPFLSCEGFTYVRCRTCGHVYQNPQPEQDDLAERYDGNYFNYELKNEETFFQLMRLGLQDIGFSGIERGIMNADIRKPVFLDIGCATGRLLEHFNSRGWDSTGVEVCKASAEYGIKKRSLDIKIGTLEQTDFPEQRFDIVHASHVIEHVSDPSAFLREIHRILRNDGFCILTTPNRGGFQARLFRERWRSAIVDHIHLFSKKTVTAFLKKTGFRVVKLKTWGGLSAGAGPAIVKKVLDRAAKSFGFGDVMILLARKESAL